jgi:beta-glucanase (GH16 family)
VTANRRDRHRPRWTSLLKSAAAALAMWLVFGVPLGADDRNAVSRADAGNACPPAPPAVVDDFSGPAGAPPNPQLWSYFLGAGGTDGQLQAYTNSPRNASLDGNGNLAINAFNEPVDVPGFGTFPYSSAWLNTPGQLDFCFGTVAARIKLPAGSGLRPTFWLLGSNVGTVGWPDAGEIDIMELPDGGSTLHGVGGYLLPFRVPLAVGTGWHEYSLNWRPDEISTFMDGQLVGTWTPASLPPGTPWTFNDNPMFVILSMPIGGPYGMPDASTPFPATMLVDWVRYTPLA